MTLDPTTTSDRARPGLAALVMASGAAGLAAGIAVVSGGLPGPTSDAAPAWGTGSQVLSAMALCIVLLMWGTGPAWAGALLLKRPRLAMALPVWAAVVGLASWWLSDAGVAILAGAGASAGGTAAAGAVAGGQHAVRDVALCCIIVLVLTLASVLVAAASTMPWRTAARCALPLLLIGAPWVALGWAAFLYAPDMGAGRLVRPEPWTGTMALLAAVLAVGINGAAVGHCLRRPAARRVLAAALVTCLCAAAGWLLVNWLATLDAAGQGRLSSAVPAFLNLDAGPESAPGERAVRWCVAYLAAVLVLAWGQWSGLLLGRYETAAAGAGRPAAGAGRGAVGRGRPGAEADRRAPPRPQGSAAPGRLYLFLAITYGVFIVYGSLVPLEYKGKPFDAALEQFLNTPYLLLHIQDRADLVANLLLYIPVTFFAMGAWTRENSRPGRWFMAACVTTAACGLAVAVEFLQVYFPPRTVSLNDIIAEWIGSGAGAAAWYLSGGRVTDWCRRLWRLRSRRRLAAHILTGYAVVFILYQFYPYDIIISTAELAAEVRKVVLIPFADLDRMSFLAIGAKTAMMIPVGYLVAVVKPRLRWPVFHAAFIGGVLVLAIQALRLLIHSRGASATDVVLGAIGAGAGAWAAVHFGPVATRPLLWSPVARGIGWTVRLAAAVAGIAMMVWYKWAPFDFHWPKEGGLAYALGWVRIPFFHQYWNTEFQATLQVGQDFGAPLILGILWASVLRRLGTAGRVIATLIAAGAGAIIEACQLFFPPRVPDLTTVFIAMAGGILGVYLYDGLVWVFLTTPSAEDEARGPCAPT
ncbi:MAG: VanZ family protein [Planctomycetes bacterium]|nr:VanZ family protein [Planctomycetota bacterium]